jgi:hypothetical protein
VPLPVDYLVIRRYLGGRPDPFRSVRDLGRAAVGCPCKSGVPKGRSSVWLPARLPAGMSGADKRRHSPGRRTMPPRPSSHMTPTTVSTPPASRGRQRARTARARGIRPTTVSSAPVPIHLRIRLLRVNGGAPYLPTEPADWLHTTRFRLRDRSLIAAPCHPRLRSVSSMVRFCALQERTAQNGCRLGAQVLVTNQRPTHYEGVLVRCSRVESPR